MTEITFAGDGDNAMARKIDEYAAEIGWDGIRPDFQWVATMRKTSRTATAQKRSAFYFAAANHGGTIKVVGPTGSRKGAVLCALNSTMTTAADLLGKCPHYDAGHEGASK